MFFIIQIMNNIKIYYLIPLIVAYIYVSLTYLNVFKPCNEIF